LWGSWTGPLRRNGPKWICNSEPNLGRSFGTFDVRETGPKRLLDQAEHLNSGAILPGARGGFRTRQGSGTRGISCE